MLEEFLSKNNKKTYTIEQDGKEMGRFTETELGNFLDGRDVESPNGVMYRTDKDGLLPFTIRKWFDERVEYRKLSKKFHEQDDKEQSGYFDRRQYLQKILLNSLYGVLGLSVFRFYDLDNEKDSNEDRSILIKFTKKILTTSIIKNLVTKKIIVFILILILYFILTPIVQKKIS